MVHDEAKAYLYKDATFELAFYLARPIYAMDTQSAPAQRLAALIRQIPLDCLFWDKIEKLRVVPQSRAEDTPRCFWEKADVDAVVSILSAAKATVTEFLIHLETYDDILKVI
ncbi:hypothetical protein EG328_010041 [Venturia inaequalis]|nr:hypothetical protein EG328_010041 [Venturia inaequalis]KAE9988842.1 hypothetical protein EG327_003205 [Venturia inaequalis]RDI76749.1 hypothetical protein Vi05172_g13270 [Venturia inaequalis]